MPTQDREVFEHYPQDKDLNELRSYAPMLFQDLYGFKKHWPTKLMMSAAFDFARELSKPYPWLVLPYKMSSFMIRKASPDMDDAKVIYYSQRIGHIFAWLTHQRIYEYSKDGSEWVLNEYRPVNDLPMTFLHSLPEVGLHLLIPYFDQAENPEALPAAVSVTLDCLEHPDDLWLHLRLDFRLRVTEFLLPIVNGEKSKTYTLGETLDSVEEKDRYTLYPVLQLLGALCTPKVTLRTSDNNLVLLPTRPSIHPALDDSFKWPNEPKHCFVGWAGVPKSPHQTDIRSLW